MKKVLVLGAGGFIGSHLVKRLKSEGYWVRGVDVKYPEFSKTHADEFIIGDLRDSKVCDLVVDKTIDETLLANLTNIKTYKNTVDKIWLLTFNTEEDMRPKVFDFAHDNGLKTLQISLKNKNLEQIFREKTKK